MERPSHSAGDVHGRVGVPRGHLPTGTLPSTGSYGGSVTLPPKGHLPTGTLPSSSGSVYSSSRNDGWPWREERIYPGAGYRRDLPPIVYNGGVTVVDRYGNVTVFNGYGTTYIPGQTCHSPWSVYGCPSYIRSTYVVTTPWVYASGREATALWPYADNDRYYASDVVRGRALRGALNDLTRFWEENDVRALRRHVAPDFSVGIFQDERYLYSLRHADVLALSADALDRSVTLSFRFENVRQRTDGLVNAYGTHTYRVRGDNTPRVATVRYTLVYFDGEWYVSAISLAPGIAGSLP